MKKSNVDMFRSLTDEMVETFAAKNADYGSSFDESLDEDGLIAAKVRIGDKFKRFSQLINNPAQVKSESIRDTLMDTAVYSVLTVMWLENQCKKSDNKPIDHSFEAWLDSNGSQPSGWTKENGTVNDFFNYLDKLLDGSTYKYKILNSLIDIFNETVSDKTVHLSYERGIDHDMFSMDGNLVALIHRKTGTANLIDKSCEHNNVTHFDNPGPDICNECGKWLREES